MKSLMDVVDTSRMIYRVNELHADSLPLWGKMNVFQMVVHCQKPFDVYFGTLQLKQGLLGWLFGGRAKKSIMTEKPLGRNLPTLKQFRITHEGDLEEEKMRLAALIHKFTITVKPDEVRAHPFFGQLTGNEWAVMCYKHTDHHLRQFGV